MLLKEEIKTPKIPETKDELRAEYEEGSPLHTKAIYGPSARDAMGLACPRYLDWLEERLLKALHTLGEMDRLDPDWRQRFEREFERQRRIREANKNIDMPSLFADDEDDE